VDTQAEPHAHGPECRWVHVGSGFVEFTFECPGPEVNRAKADLEARFPGWVITLTDAGASWHARPCLRLIPGISWFHPECTGPGTEHVHPATMLNAGSAEELAKAIKRAPVTHPYPPGRRS
jgi:hypothetical protein